MDLPEDQQPPLVEKVDAYEVGQVEKVLMSLQEMLESVMVDVVTPCVTAERAEVCIKHFLTEFHKLDQQLKKRKKKTKKGKTYQHMTVFSCPNFTTLLNVPGMLEEFGPLRLLWEGGVHGEAFVKMIKPYLKFGLKDNFATNAMLHCMQETSFQLTMEKMKAVPSAGVKGTCLESDISKLVAKRRGSITKYKSRTEVCGILARRGLLTVLKAHRKNADFDDVLVLACVSGGDGDGGSRLYPVMLTDKDGTKFGCMYHRWRLSCTPLSLQEEHDIGDWEMSFGILFPRQEASGVCSHTLICESRYKLN